MKRTGGPHGPSEWPVSIHSMLFKALKAPERLRSSRQSATFALVN